VGKKFETLLFVDRVLGLELPREIGHRPARTRNPALEAS
jgi:hypothetical protein